MSAGPEESGEDKKAHAGYVAHVWRQRQVLVDNNSEVTDTRNWLDV